MTRGPRTSSPLPSWPGPLSALPAFEDDERIGPVCWCGGCSDDPCSIADHETKAYAFGAAAMAGVIGMFQAIRARGEVCPRCQGRGQVAGLSFREPRSIVERICNVCNGRKRIGGTHD